MDGRLNTLNLDVQWELVYQLLNGIRAIFQYDRRGNSFIITQRWIWRIQRIKGVII